MVVELAVGMWVKTSSKNLYLLVRWESVGRWQEIVLGLETGSKLIDEFSRFATKLSKNVDGATV